MVLILEKAVSSFKIITNLKMNIFYLNKDPKIETIEWE